MKSLKKLFIIVDVYSNSINYFTDFVDEDRKFLKEKCKEMNKNFKLSSDIFPDKYKVLSFKQAIKNFQDKTCELKNEIVYPY